MAEVWGIDKVFVRTLDPTLTVAASHAIAGHVRANVKRQLPWVADVLVSARRTLPQLHRDSFGVRTRESKLVV